MKCAGARPVNIPILAQKLRSVDFSGPFLRLGSFKMSGGDALTFDIERFKVLRCVPHSLGHLRSLHSDQVSFSDRLQRHEVRPVQRRPVVGVFLFLDG